MFASTGQSGPVDELVDIFAASCASLFFGCWFRGGHFNGLCCGRSKGELDYWSWNQS